MIFETIFPIKPKTTAIIRPTKKLSNNTSAIIPKIIKIKIVARKGTIKNNVSLDDLSEVIIFDSVLEEPQYEHFIKQISFFI